MQNCIGSINVSSGSTALTLSTSATLLNCWNTTAGSNKDYSGGDTSVRPDKANNRVLVNGPGLGPVQATGQAPAVTHRYRVSGFISGTIDATQEITLQLRKAGTVMAGCINKRSWTVTINNLHEFDWLIEVSASDVLGTIDPNPAASTTGFSGASGNAKNAVALDLMLTSGASTPAITVVNGEMIVERVG